MTDTIKIVNKTKKPLVVSIHLVVDFDRALLREENDEASIDLTSAPYYIKRDQIKEVMVVIEKWEEE